jgi:hypothetical protein
LLTGKVIIWYASFLRHVELKVVWVALIKGQRCLNLSEMLAEPIYRDIDEIRAIEVLGNLILLKEKENVRVSLYWADLRMGQLRITYIDVGLVLSIKGYWMLYS